MKNSGKEGAAALPVSRDEKPSPAEGAHESFARHHLTKVNTEPIKHRSIWALLGKCEIGNVTYFSEVARVVWPEYLASPLGFNGLDVDPSAFRHEGQHSSTLARGRVGAVV